MAWLASAKPATRFPRITFEQLEERIVLDGATDDLSCRADLFSAQVGATHTDSDQIITEAVLAESAADVDPLVLETGTESLPDGTWHYWQNDWDAATGNGYEFHSWQDGSYTYREINWDAPHTNGYDYDYHRDHTWTYRAELWDANHNGYSYDATSEGVYHYKADQWVNGLGYSYSSDSSGEWEYFTVQQGNAPGDFVIYRSNSTGLFDFTYTWANGQTWHYGNNTLPVANDFSARGLENHTIAVSDWGMTDPDLGDSLSSVTITSLPMHGMLKLYDTQIAENQLLDIWKLGNVCFVPDADWCGTTGFLYKVTDSMGGTSENPAQVTIEVTAVNHPPVAVDDAYTTQEDTPLIRTRNEGVLVNDHDADGDTLEVILVSAPSHGTLKRNADYSATYTPEQNYNGSDTFTYKANDGIADSNVATVTITIVPVNDPPTPNPFTVISPEDTAVIVSGWSMTDVDVGDSMASVRICSLPAHGVLKLMGNTIGLQDIYPCNFGDLTFTPDTNWNGTTTFSYDISDGQSFSGHPATVTIHVAPVNDANPFIERTNMDTPVAIDGWAVANGEDIASVTITSLPEHGVLNLGVNPVTVNQLIDKSAFGLVTFVPEAGWVGTTSFGYNTIDADGAYSLRPATVTVKVVSVCDIPQNPMHLTNVYGTLFFTADDGTNGRELWKTDGTVVGTKMVKNICWEGGSSNPENLTNVNGTLFFTCRPEQYGYPELWKSDGTEAGTVMIVKFVGQLHPWCCFVAVDDMLYFGGYDDGMHQFEVWKSDGTATGTVMVKDVNPDQTWSEFPYFLTGINGTLYFAESDGRDNHGNELWTSDGTETGTVMVKDIAPGYDSRDYAISSYPSMLTNANGTAYFRVGPYVGGGELWKSDGTEAGTVLVKFIGGPDISISSTTSAGRMIGVGTRLFFSGTLDAAGYELCVSDGTEAGTVMVKDIRPGSTGSNPLYLTDVSGTVYFLANDWEHGLELWKSDGTELGTTLVRDIKPGTAGSFSRPDYDGNPASYLVNVNGTLYFAGADDGVHGKELWKSDGTEAGTVLVRDIVSGSGGSNPQYLTNVNGTLYFVANNELWAIHT